MVACWASRSVISGRRGLAPSTSGAREENLNAAKQRLVAQATYPDGEPWSSVWDNACTPVEYALIDPALMSAA